MWSTILRLLTNIGTTRKATERFEKCRRFVKKMKKSIRAVQCRSKPGTNCERNKNPQEYLLQALCENSSKSITNLKGIF